MKCVKYLLFSFNLIFLITGLALIITGCVIQGVYSNYLDFLGDSFFNTPVLLVVVGCIIFFVTFFGCCGAIKEHHGMTLAFSVFLALILIIELGAGIASYTFRDQVFYPIVYEYFSSFYLTVYYHFRVSALYCIRFL